MVTVVKRAAGGQLGPPGQTGAAGEEVLGGAGPAGLDVVTGGAGGPVLVGGQIVVDVRV